MIVVGNSSIHGYYPIRKHNIPGFVRGFDVHTGQAALEVQSHSAARRVRRGDVEEGLEDRHARASARTTRGRRTPPIPSSASSTSRSACRSIDEYGGHRPGDNLFGNSVVAIDVKTGKRKWHYQFVHHDIWDYDTPMAPNLLDVTVERAARARSSRQTTKQGWVYMLDRVTGEPIWPIAETPVLQSEVPGEKTSPTQPIPSQAGAVRAAGTRRGGSHRLHAGDQGLGAQAREEVPHGSVLHSRRRRPTARARTVRRSTRARGTRRARAAA